MSAEQPTVPLKKGKPEFTVIKSTQEAPASLSISEQRLRQIYVVIAGDPEEDIYMKKFQELSEKDQSTITAMGLCYASAIKSLIDRFLKLKDSQK